LINFGIISPKGGECRLRKCFFNHALGYFCNISLYNRPIKRKLLLFAEKKHA